MHSSKPRLFPMVATPNPLEVRGSTFPSFQFHEAFPREVNSGQNAMGDTPMAEVGWGGGGTGSRPARAASAWSVAGGAVAPACPGARPRGARAEQALGARRACRIPSAPPGDPASAPPLPDDRLCPHLPRRRSRRSPRGVLRLGWKSTARPRSTTCSSKTRWCRL